MKYLLLTAAGLTLATTAQAATISLYDNGSSGTIGTTITSDGVGDFGFVGTQGYSGVTGATAGKSFGTEFIQFTGGSFTVARSGLAAHTSLSLDFLLAAVDSLDGDDGTFGPDRLEVSIDLDGDGIAETSLFNHSYLNCDRVAGVQTAGTAGQLAYRQNLYNTGNPDTCFLDSAYDMGVRLEFQNIAHTLSTLTLAFAAPGQQGAGDESFAIDALSVTLNGVQEEVPEPAMLGLFGLGTIGLGLSRRRRS